MHFTPISLPELATRFPAADRRKLLAAKDDPSVDALVLYEAAPDQKSNNIPTRVVAVGPAYQHTAAGELKGSFCFGTWRGAKVKLVDTRYCTLLHYHNATDEDHGEH